MTFKLKYQVIYFLKHHNNSFSKFGGEAHSFTNIHLD